MLQKDKEDIKRPWQSPMGMQLGTRWSLSLSLSLCSHIPASPSGPPSQVPLPVPGAQLLSPGQVPPSGKILPLTFHLFSSAPSLWAFKQAQASALIRGRISRGPTYRLHTRLPESMKSRPPPSRGSWLPLFHSPPPEGWPSSPLFSLTANQKKIFNRFL